MASGALFHLIILIFLSAASARISSESIIRLPSENHVAGGGNRKVRADDGAYCDSWRLAVETNNAGKWKRVPSKCAAFVEEYMGGERYSLDSDVIARFSSAFAKSVEVEGGGRDAWVFDVDETLLSNALYYAENGFGTQIFNETSFDIWVNSAKAPALAASLNLYKELQELGFKIFLLTGRSEHQRNATEANLLFAGYSNWERLILRGPSDQGKPATTYKSEKRAELVPNIWSSMIQFLSQNLANRQEPGCGEGTGVDRSRTATTGALKKKLKDKMSEFQILRESIRKEYRDVVERRVFTVTGTPADEETIDQLIETGDSEQIFQRAIQEQGRGQIMDTLAEIQERHDAVRELERKLLGLQQIFLDMAVLVEAQGDMLDNIESQVSGAVDHVQSGNTALQRAKRLQKNSRKWMCIAIIILLIVVAVIVVAVIQPWDNKK